MRPAGRVVAVFGATGHTGRFVVAELLRHGFAPVAVARDAGKLAAIGFRERGVVVRAAAVDDPSALDLAFDGAAAVINCAGPFLDTAEAVAAAAIRAQAHYLDVSAEQPSTRTILERFDAPACAAGLVAMPATGFYGGLADLLRRQRSATGTRPTRSASASRSTAGTRQRARASPAGATPPRG